MRVWICGECRLTGRRNFDIVRVSEIVLGGLSRIADSSWCGKASSWRRIAAGLSEKIRWKEVKDRQKGILCQRRAKSLVLKRGDLPERGWSMMVLLCAGRDFLNWKSRTIQLWQRILPIWNAKHQQNQLLFAQGVDINMMVEEKPDGMRRNSWLFTGIILWLTGAEHLFAYGTPLSWTWSMWRNMRIEKSVIIGTQLYLAYALEALSKT